MNEPEFERFEEELRRLRPRAAPADLMDRLAEARPSRAPSISARQGPGVAPDEGTRPTGLIRWPSLVRWLVPAAALALIVGVVWPAFLTTARHETAPGAAIPPPGLKADSVQLDQQLVGTFDAVGRLSGGEPVRFRYQRWMDQLVIKDKASGVVIQQRTPRVEVIPVGFETY